MKGAFRHLQAHLAHRNYWKCKVSFYSDIRRLHSKPPFRAPKSTNLRLIGRSKTFGLTRDRTPARIIKDDLLRSAPQEKRSSIFAIPRYGSSGYQVSTPEALGPKVAQPRARPLGRSDRIFSGRTKFIRQPKGLSRIKGNSIQIVRYLLMFRRNSFLK